MDFEFTLHGLKIIMNIGISWTYTEFGNEFSNEVHIVMIKVADNNKSFLFSWWWLRILLLLKNCNYENMKTQAWCYNNKDIYRPF